MEKTLIEQEIEKEILEAQKKEKQKRLEFIKRNKFFRKDQKVRVIALKEENWYINNECEC